MIFNLKFINSRFKFKKSNFNDQNLFNSFNFHEKNLNLSLNIESHLFIY